MLGGADSCTPAQRLRSSDNLLSVSHTLLALSPKAFSVSAPTTWNSLSDDYKDVKLLITFRWLVLKQ